MATADEYVVDFPTLWVGAAWIEAHCVIPDGFRAGAPFEMYDWQLWCHVNHYRVKATAEWVPENPVLGPAFHYRRSQIIAPQKCGKGPGSACQCALEGAGPALFAGWAGTDDGYACEDHGCGCGWEYAYEPGEPMGMRWPTPLIQIMAMSEDQTDNIFKPLKRMIELGPLGGLMRAGEDLVRIGVDGEIAVVTSSANSRIGNPLTYGAQDETGLYTAANKMRKVAETTRRNAAGMGGRTQETSNIFDPSEDSVAQRTYESTAQDVFRFYRPPPPGLKYTIKADRRKIHRHVYKSGPAGGSRHVDLDSIEGEAAELAEKDPEQAARFFGNMLVYAQGSWMDGDRWKGRAAPREVPDGTAIVLGFDGSDVNDHTGFRAQTRDGYQFTPTYGPDKRPAWWDPAKFGGQVPRLEVDAALEEFVERFVLVRGYFDPPDWKSEIDDWAGRFGEKRILRWETYRPVQMHAACERLHKDVTKKDATFTHDGCDVTETHVRNARKVARGLRYVLAKPSPQQKIDMTVCSILCNEAAGDVTAADLWPDLTESKMVVFRGRRGVRRRS